MTHIDCHVKFHWNRSWYAKVLKGQTKGSWPPLSDLDPSQFCPLSSLEFCQYFKHIVQSHHDPCVFFQVSTRRLQTAPYGTQNVGWQIKKKAAYGPHTFVKFIWNLQEYIFMILLGGVWWEKEGIIAYECTSYLSRFVTDSSQMIWNRLIRGLWG